ncbi:MAG: hypothetical protein DRO98_08285 [Archaeoglobales archaeon]|nr:MAG: hypothetical protein DRO98_08285 [Archaeoglobales archaeon]
MQITLETIYSELQKMKKEIEEIKWMLIPEEEPDDKEKEVIEEFLRNEKEGKTEYVDLKDLIEELSE